VYTASFTGGQKYQPSPISPPSSNASKSDVSLRRDEVGDRQGAVSLNFDLKPLVAKDAGAPRQRWHAGMPRMADIVGRSSHQERDVANGRQRELNATETP